MFQDEDENKARGSVGCSGKRNRVVWGCKNWGHPKNIWGHPKKKFRCRGRGSESVVYWMRRLEEPEEEEPEEEEPEEEESEE